ncbi:MAG: AAA family ATPase [Chloroflexia bacterium]
MADLYKSENGSTRREGWVNFADVVDKQVSWLWPGRIPLRHLSMIEGDPSVGKSLLTLDLAARVTTGSPIPDGGIGDLGGPAGVVILSADDDVDRTIRPRLEAAHADLSRISVQRLPSLTDLDKIEAAILRKEAKLVIIDPLMAYLPAGVNTSRALAPLARLAERSGAAILLVRSLYTGGAGQRRGASTDIITAPRSTLLVARDPLNITGACRILVCTKHNLTVRPPDLAFRIEAAPTGAAAIVWA